MTIQLPFLLLLTILLTNMFSLKNLILFTLFAMNLMDQPAPIVKIEQGVLSGKVNSDGTVFEYLGIPYASTKGRFKAPLPPVSWNGIFKAIDEHYQCPQNIIGGITGMEDCLKINVYVPATNHLTNLPVMVYIHGGGFLLGNGGKMLYGPEFLVKHDVILVTFNYRIGALGFLCLGIKEAPGNAGLKDQIAALKWVKKNIPAFGGDPDNVTIFGHSAGAASVSLLIASEVSNGLFNRAIVQSGTALSVWTSAAPVVIAKSVAKHLGFKTEDAYELYNLFANMSLSNIVSRAWGQPIINLLNTKTFHIPCIENNIPGEEAFMTDFPYNMLLNKPKNISIIYGITDKEGLYLISEETEESLEVLNHNVYPFPDLEFSSENEANEVSSLVKRFYFGDKIISHQTLSNLSDLFGDVYLSVPTILESEVLLNKVEAPIYNYYFKYSGGRNIIKASFCKNSDDSGASHGDDILYIFNAYVWPFSITEKDQKIVNWMTEMWTNFAKYGDPTPPFSDIPVRWKPSTKDSLNFLYIDEDLKMGQLPEPERYHLWKRLYEKFRKTRL